MEALSAMFGDAFDDVSTYTGKRPSADYLRKLHDGGTFIALAAMDNNAIADLGDDPAISLYTTLGAREDVLHFDIAVGDRDRA